MRSNRNTPFQFKEYRRTIVVQKMRSNRNRSWRIEIKPATIAFRKRSPRPGSIRARTIRTGHLFRNDVKQFFIANLGDPIEPFSIRTRVNKGYPPQKNKIPIGYPSIIWDELLPEVATWRVWLENVRPISPGLLSRVTTLHLSAQTLYQALRENGLGTSNAEQKTEFNRLMAERDELQPEVATFFGRDVGMMGIA